MTNTNNNTFKFDDDVKQTIIEISAISGYPQAVVKECLEYLVYNWAIKIADNPDTYAELKIPFLGTLGVKYEKDIILKSGELSTEVSVYTELSDPFKKLVGDLHDEGKSILEPIMLKKIENAVMMTSNKSY